MISIHTFIHFQRSNRGRELAFPFTIKLWTQRNDIKLIYNGVFGQNRYQNELNFNYKVCLLFRLAQQAHVATIVGAAAMVIIIIFPHEHVRHSGCALKGW